MMKYILKNKRVVKVEDVIEWSDWFETADRIVKQTKLKNGYRVSTVFLGTDHSFTGGPPLLFETMVFKGKDWSNLDMDRYSTWDEAVEGHKQMVKKWRYKN